MSQTGSDLSGNAIPIDSGPPDPNLGTMILSQNPGTRPPSPTSSQSSRRPYKRACEGAQDNDGARAAPHFAFETPKKRQQSEQHMGGFQQTNQTQLKESIPKTEPDLIYLLEYLSTGGQGYQGGGPKWVEFANECINRIGTYLINTLSNENGCDKSYAISVRDTLTRLIDLTDDDDEEMADDDEWFSEGQGPARNLSSMHAPASSQQPKPAFNSNTENSAVMSALLDIKSELRRSSERMDDFERRLRSTTPAKRGPNQSPPMTQSSQPTTSAPTPNTYASRASAAPAAAPKPSQATKPTPAPKKGAQNQHFIVRFHGNPPSPQQQAAQTPTIMAQKLNNHLHRTPTMRGAKVLGAEWAPSGNIILTFPPAPGRSLIEEHLPAIRVGLGLAPGHPITYDGQWSKVTLNGVRVNVFHDVPIATEEMLVEALRQNPAFHDIQFTQPPRWIRPSEDIATSGAAFSSVSLAFEDPDGKLVKKLLKESLFMFGAPVQIRRWIDKPKLQQCVRCWALDHPVTKCPAKKPRCRHCGLNHKEEDHRRLCIGCKNLNRPDSEPCLDDYHCINCKGAHLADSTDCPARRKFSIPLQNRTTTPDDTENMA